MKKRTISTILAMAFSTVACIGAAAATSEEVTYPSRDASVPATVTLPDEAEDAPLVVICHGHGGDRSENGGLDAIADALAEQGIASIRMDYPGCGASEEEFSQNNMTNMKEDTINAISFMTETYGVDADAVGIFGYSMGGRIAVELIAEEAYDFEAAGLLAPAVDTEDLKNLFGGADNWEQLKADANASEDGWVEFVTIYGQEQHLGTQWFDDLEANDAKTLLDKAAEAFDEDALVVYAVDDEAVSPSVSQAAADALGAQVVKTPEDGHSYGFYGGPAYVKRIVVENMADFFAAALD